MSNSNTGKIALVTGTSTGIGLSTAVLLAQAGFTVVATMRNTAKADHLKKQVQEANVNIDIRQLDVESDDSVTTCVQEVIKQYGKIDLLVNNAGTGYLGTMEQTSLQDLRHNFETNFFGVWRVTQAVFPSMREAHSGRIITVTSVGGIIGQPFNDAYCAAKFAVEGWMEAFAPVAKQLGIQVSLIEPGPVNTNFVSSVLGSMPEGGLQLQEVYGPMIQSYMGNAQERFATTGQTPEQVGQIIIEATTAETPHFRYGTSQMVQGIVTRKYSDISGDNMVALFAEQIGKK